MFSHGSFWCLENPMQFDPKTTKRQLEREILRLMDIITEMRAARQGDDLMTYAFEDAESQLGENCGYYRMGRDYRTGEFWARYKWTSGRHAERYQFGSGSTLAIALAACNQNVADVERGIRKGILDRGYKPAARGRETDS
jgi:hypothetical protein